MEKTKVINPEKLADLPVKNEEFTFNDWEVFCSSSHILPSKCSPPCRSHTPCSFCYYSKELNLSHLPEMVYPSNVLRLKHKSGCTIEFNTLEALKCVKSRCENVKIACADNWRKAREDSGLVDRVADNFDWTFQSDYEGTYSNWDSIETTNLAIDLNKLKQKEEILLYKELTLFEDELHDNGISLSSVRIRVMPSGFFILLRFFLRVDGVMLCTYDSRLHHEFENGYALLETSFRQSKVSDLKVPLYVMNDPDEVTPMLQLQSTTCKKLTIPPVHEQP